MSDRNTLHLAARNDFLLFYQLIHHLLDRTEKYQGNWSHLALAHHLLLCEKGELLRLIVNMPPRTLKSLITSVAWVAYQLGRDPTLRIMCLSYGDDLAQYFARRCRELMESDLYRAIFPNTKLARDAAHDLETTAGGGRYAVAMGGVVTGRGADIIIIDDPQKISEAQSEAARAKTIEFFRGTLASRLNNRKTGRIIVIQQRVHLDDLTGHLLTNEASHWTHLKLPAQNEDGDRQILVGQDLYHHWPDGAYLHPERDGEKELAHALEQHGSFAYASQFQQNPLSFEGNAIKRVWFGPYDALPTGPGARTIIAVDTAVSAGSNNDYTVMLVAVVARNTIYLKDVVRKKLDFPAQLDTLIALSRKHEAKVILIEKAATGSPMVAALKRIGAFKVPTPIAIGVRSSKEDRVTACSARIEAGDLLLPKDAPWKDEYLNELCGFPFGRHDDQVDATTLLLNWRGIGNGQQPLGGTGAMMDSSGHWSGPLADELNLNGDKPRPSSGDNLDDHPLLRGWVKKD